MPDPSPSGTHDYEFTSDALGVGRLDLSGKVSLDAFADAMEPKTLAKAMLVVPS
jgi:phosphatidylethanolamine-binding protein (PEBP) family uncharacterized protein